MCSWLLALAYFTFSVKSLRTEWYLIMLQQRQTKMQRLAK